MHLINPLLTVNFKTTASILKINLPVYLANKSTFTFWVNNLYFIVITVMQQKNFVIRKEGGLGSFLLSSVYIKKIHIL